MFIQLNTYNTDGKGGHRVDPTIINTDSIKHIQPAIAATEEAEDEVENGVKTILFTVDDGHFDCTDDMKTIADMLENFDLLIL